MKIGPFYCVVFNNLTKMFKYLMIFLVFASCHANKSVENTKCFEDEDYANHDYHIESITPNRNLSYGYSLFWDNETQSLFFVDNDFVTECLFRYDFLEKKLYAAGIEGGYSNPSFLIPLEGCDNLFVVSIDRTVMIIEWDGKSSTAKFVRNATSVEQDPIYDTNHFDSGKPDPHGRLVAGTYRTDYCPETSNPLGAVYLFEENGNIRTLINTTHTKSLVGLGFDEKRNLFYTLGFCLNYISEYDWSPQTGLIGNPRVAFTFPALKDQNYVPGGLDLDSCGNLYVGLYNASLILKINPRTGNVKRWIHVPVETVTSITWGGPKLDILFVTTSSTILDAFVLRSDNVFPLAPSDRRGQTLMITGLGENGVPASRLKNYL